MRSESDADKVEIRCRLSQMTAFFQPFQGGCAITRHSVNSNPPIKKARIERALLFHANVCSWPEAVYSPSRNINA